MATDLHKFLEKRGMAWLYSHGFRMTACEVHMEWTVGKRRTPEYKKFEENADVMGVGILNQDARSCVIEVKVSRGDFLSDFKKPHRVEDNPYITERYYLAPAGLLKPEEIPDRWGLLEYQDEEDKIYIKKRAKRRLLAHLTKKQRIHGNTPPWKIPLEQDIIGGIAMWGHAWSCVIERMANDYRFKHIGIHPKKIKGRRKLDRNEYTVDK